MAKIRDNIGLIKLALYMFYIASVYSKPGDKLIIRTIGFRSNWITERSL